MSSSYSSLIDDDGDLDISLIEGPLLFSFVSEDYIKMPRVKESPQLMMNQ